MHFYQDLSQNTIFSKDDQKRLTNIMSHISSWHYEDIFFFGNTLGLLNSQTIYKLAKIINCADNIYINNKGSYTCALDTLLNAISILIRRNYKLAKKLLYQFNHLPLSDRSAFKKAYIAAFQAYIHYIETKDNTEVQTIIKTTELLDLPNLKDAFVTIFNQVKQIYG